jgi:hypothetical protein
MPRGVVGEHVVSRTELWCLRLAQLEGRSSVKVRSQTIDWCCSGIAVCMLESRSVGRDDLHVGWIVGTDGRRKGGT